MTAQELVISTTSYSEQHPSIQVTAATMALTICTHCMSAVTQSLKNKLGTRQLPTAELLLDGTAAMMVSMFSPSLRDHLLLL